MAKVVDLLDKYYKQTNYNCAEAVFSAAREAWNLDIPEETVKTMACFGGGMGSGIVCGAISGGGAALSCKFVQGDGGHTSPLLMDLTRKYIRRSREEYGSEACKDLRKQFFTQEERCYHTIYKIATILDEVYEEGIRVSSEE